MLTLAPPKLSEASLLTYADAKTTAEAKCTPAGSLMLTLATPKLSEASYSLMLTQKQLLKLSARQRAHLC